MLPIYFFLSELNLNSFKAGDNLPIQPLKKSDWKGNRILRSENAPYWHFRKGGEFIFLRFYSELDKYIDFYLDKIL